MVATIVAIVATASLTTGALAAKPSGATLDVSFSTASSLTDSSTTALYWTPYVVSGCGYNPANGGVTIVVHSPQAIAFAGGVPDSNGCISVSNFSTQTAGTYQVDAYQQIRHRSSLLASTSFTLD
jgi:hypothetical protein